MLRIFELDVRFRAEAVSDDEFTEVWSSAHGLPGALEGTGLPGHRLLDTRDGALGGLPTLPFDSRGDGLDAGGVAVTGRCSWVLRTPRVHHPYRHCCADQRQARLPELGCIASFEELDDESERREP